MMMRTNADIIIGIDPDVNKSGVARLEGNRVELSSLSFPILIDFLMRLKGAELNGGPRAVIVVEASWKISHNWHAHRGDSKGTVARKGNDAGRCHEVGRKIVECARYYGLEVVEKLPLKKIWRGRDGKITHEEISAFMAIGKRSNQEERDAALLAWDYAGLPIRITTKLK
jgi:hypothetical protein